MKLKEGFVTYNAEDTHMMVSMGKTEFSGIVRSNETAAFIVEQLKTEVTEETLILSLMYKYSIDKNTAQRGVHKVLDTLRNIGAIEE